MRLLETVRLFDEALYGSGTAQSGKTGTTVTVGRVCDPVANFRKSRSIPGKCSVHASNMNVKNCGPFFKSRKVDMNGTIKTAWS